MTLGTLLSVAGEAATKIGAAIAGASTLALVKVGVVAGIGVGVGIVVSKFIMRYLKNKKDIMTNEEDKTVVDRAVQVNYADEYNREQLNPIFKKVKKQFNKEQGVRGKKKTLKRIKRELDSRTKERMYARPNFHRSMYDVDFDEFLRRPEFSGYYEPTKEDMINAMDYFENVEIPIRAEQLRNYKRNDNAIADIWNMKDDIPRGSHDYLFDPDYIYDCDVYEDFKDVDWQGYFTGFRPGYDNPSWAR